MKGKKETLLIIAATVVIIIITHFYTLLYTPASHVGEGRAVTVEIPRGVSFRVIANNLEKEGLIKDSEGIVWAAYIRGAYKKVQAGEYEFSTSMTPLEILNYLTSGKIKRYPVTIPEGFNIKDIAATLEKAGLAKKEEFMARATGKKFVKAYGFEGDRLEGYLFPDTYMFTKSVSLEEITGKMVQRFKDVYDSEFHRMAEKKGMTTKEVITLASIIEKETGSAGEMSAISAVFHNRLKKRIPLQSDPTVIYGLANFDGNLTKKHLVAKTPYNTYLKYGLPPTPIANPGRAAIDAALNPADEKYLYFVSKNDGTHYFSKTLEEHNRAVGIYQKNGFSLNRPQG